MVAAKGPADRSTKRATGAGLGGPEGKAAVDAWNDAPPRGAPELDGCDGVDDPYMCEVREVHFVREWWRGAHHGDLFAAKDVGRCLAVDGEPCGVLSDAVGGCAWSLFAATSPDAGDAEADDVGLHCGRLAPAGLYTAKAKAAQLLQALPTLHRPG